MRVVVYFFFFGGGVFLSMVDFPRTMAFEKEQLENDLLPPQKKNDNGTSTI